MIFDTHTHLFLGGLKNKTHEIIKDLEKNNVKYINSIGIDIDSSILSIDLAKQYKGKIFATVGIHPSHCIDYQNNIDDTIKKLEQLIIENREYIVAVGECGLDYFRLSGDKQKDDQTKQIQKDFFSKQILLALKYNLAVVVHTREAKEDTLDILKKYNCKKFVLHCFSEDLDFALKSIYYSPECKISFSGIVTYKTAQNVQTTAANIALDKILIETDCPYLAPQAVRGQENNPYNTNYILDHIVSLRKEDHKIIEDSIFLNSLNFFGIKFDL